MEQALAFAVSAGLGYMFLRREYQSQLGETAWNNGLNTLTLKTTRLQPANYSSTAAKSKIVMPGGMNPVLAQKQTDDTTLLRFEQRHPCMDSFKMTGNPPASINDNSIPLPLANGNPYWH
jgi:hypothetical protein